MRRLVLLFVLSTAFGAVNAEAITVREIIELSKTGLSDDVLLALIDIERKVFPVDPETLKTLKEAGVSERVIIAMIRSGRGAPAALESSAGDAAAAAAAPPQVIVVDHHDHDAPIVREVAVAVPVYVGVPVYVRAHRRGDGRHVDGRHVDYVPAAPPAPSIGLRQSRLGLSAPPPKPTSDPPGWRKSVYLKR